VLLGLRARPTVNASAAAARRHNATSTRAAEDVLIICDIYLICDEVGFCDSERERKRGGSIKDVIYDK
jgi:hypothetical protein